MKWTWWRLLAAACAAVGIAAFAFAVRFNALGGTMGGFDNDHFVHLVRTDLLLHGEQPLRDFADAELRGAWPSLGYAASAWAQRAWGHTLLSEAYLTVGVLALSTAGVFLLALRLSQSWSVALLSAACVIAAHPKLYNYEKVLVLFVGVLLIRAWIERPSVFLVALMSTWTAVATLFRHDFGVYVGLAAIVALLVRGPAPAGQRLRRALIYAALTVALLLPSLIWVQQYTGLVEYAQRAVETVRGESGRTALGWPTFQPELGWWDDNLASLVYYAFWVVIALGGAALTVHVRLRRGADQVIVATGVALFVVAAVVTNFFLRGNLFARFGDAIVPLVLLAAWGAGAIAVADSGRRTRVLIGAVPRALLLVIATALFIGTEMRVELDAAGFTDSWERVQKRFEDARADLRKLPPDVWSNTGAEGTLAVSRYLAECTAPADRVLLATYAPEIPVFARRLVAAGQGTFGLTFYEAEPQQREAVARLERQSVPIVIGAYEDFEGEFADDYRLVHRYVAAHYRDAGAIPVEGHPRFRVLVATDREAVRVDPVLGLPCFR